MNTSLLKSDSRKSERLKEKVLSHHQEAAWRGRTVAELAWLAVVPERKDGTLELKDSSARVSKQRGNEVSQ